MKKILVTGAAGFIGYHLCERLLKDGHSVVGLDNINGYYDINLKLSRLKELGVEQISENQVSISKIHNEKFRFIKINLEDQINLDKLFEEENFNDVINLAAQAGVRYSIENPRVYIESNIVGFLNLMECMRKYGVNNLIFASSSSVYGNSSSTPFDESENVDKPISLYAATKKTNELIAHTYSHLFDIKTTGLRFFTVYGPWGRPDMAMFLFIDAIYNNKPIKVFNQGELSRDFTFIDDIIDGITLILDKGDSHSENYKIYNLGNNKPVKLMSFIESIEKITGKEAIKEMLPMQQGDVNATWANVNQLITDYGYSPKVTIEEGVKSFVNWYKKYYKIS
jgi:UDP-glucuronate 4-epimerase